jgi:hypothetical protein
MTAESFSPFIMLTLISFLNWYWDICGLNAIELILFIDTKLTDYWKLDIYV